VLIHAGDFSNIGLPHDITALSEWLGGLPFRHKVVIAGTLPPRRPCPPHDTHRTRTHLLYYIHAPGDGDVVDG
jgi:3',5'-cyclic AMP phosphodiesterase CpdA